MRSLIGRRKGLSTPFKASYTGGRGGLCTEVALKITNYQLPNGRIKVRRRWGQRHPQGANSGSNGKLKLMLNSKQLPPAHPYPMLANVY
jgi:hypothetical protein